MLSPPIDRPMRGVAVRFGDDATRDQWWSDYRAARKAQRVEHAVSPLHHLVTRQGERLVAAEEVRLEHFDPAFGAPQAQLERLIDQAIVIKK